MKVIVFGGTGLIGTGLLASSRMRSHEVVVVTRNPRLPAREGIVWCAYDPAALAAHFSGKYGIVNLAGAGIGDRPWTKKRKRTILESRLKVSRLIADLVKKAGDSPEFVIQASAVGYYGTRGEEILTERSGRGNGFLPEVTEKWESALQEELSDCTRLVFIRTGLVLSNKGGFLGPSNAAFRLYAGGHFGNGRQWMPWIHVEDEVGAIIYLMDQAAAKGVFNLVAPHPVRGKEFYNLFGKILKRPSWLHLPAFVFKLLPGGFGKELILTSQNVKPARLLELGYTFQFTDVEPALLNLFGHE